MTKEKIREYNGLTYKYAIDARDKLNDSYYKWMSYYYLANAGILLGITTIYKNDDPLAVLLFACIGFFVCILWHLSCKGYYYWSNSWINIIIQLEEKLSDDEYQFGVYSIFSEKAHNTQNNFFKINKGANVSTPKLTMIFSSFAIFAWLFYGVIHFFRNFDNLSNYTKCGILIGFLILFVAVYVKYLPTIILSKNEDMHRMV